MSICVGVPLKNPTSHHWWRLTSSSRTKERIVVELLHVHKEQVHALQRHGTVTRSLMMRVVW